MRGQVSECKSHEGYPSQPFAALRKFFSHFAQGRLPLDDVAFGRLGVSKRLSVFGWKEKSHTPFRGIHIRDHDLHLSRMAERRSNVTLVPECSDDLSANLQLLFPVRSLWRQENHVAHPMQNISTDVSHHFGNCGFASMPATFCTAIYMSSVTRVLPWFLASRRYASCQGTRPTRHATATSIAASRCHLLPFSNA